MLTAPDLSRLVRYEALTDGAQWRVGGSGGRRSTEIGTAIGILALRHAGGYEIILQFEDGKIDSFSPFSLFPAESRHGTGARA